VAADANAVSESGEDACDGFVESPVDLTVRPAPGGGFLLEAGDIALRCVVGRSGLKREKREGDGATPIGRWPLREVFYRPDRLSAPLTRLPVRALTPSDGWCDAPGDPHYNRPVQLPFAPSHEELWRKDEIYDVIVVMGYNDEPPVAGLGSAIFFHISRPDYGPTAGCVAIPLERMLDLLTRIGPETHIVVQDS
jgi:L,D-peptidoglycan transpeptidase YkuD (ErfK/YbiS/YcfS/YnhG family)